MKKFNLSLVTILAMGTFAVAGGDIEPVAEPVVEVVASDDSGFYIGGAYSLTNTSVDYHTEYGDYDGYHSERTGTRERDNNAYMLLAGYQFNQYLSVEGRYWNSMDETNEERNDGEEIDEWSDGAFEAWGIYVKPMYPVTEAFSVYGLLGYGNVSIDDDYWNDAPLVDESGFQWGIGASYAFTENLSLFGDFVQLCSDVEDSAIDEDNGWDYDEADWETSIYTVNFGLMYKF